MTSNEPTADLDAAYSDPGAEPTSWTTALQALAAAELSWISTVRPDGRPHVTPLITVCEDSTVYFCIGPNERKARNLARNAHVVLTTGANTPTPCWVFAVAPTTVFGFAKSPYGQTRWRFDR